MSKKIATTSVAMAFLAILPSSFVHANDDWNNTVSILFGNKVLDTDVLDEKDHSTTAIGFDIQHKDWPVAISIDLIGAGKEPNNNSSEELVTGALHLGLKKHWGINDFEPYLGGGLNFAAVSQTKINANILEEQEGTDLGAWLSTGAYWKLYRNITIGIELRYSYAETELFNSKLKTGGMHSLVTIGYQF